MSSLRTADAFGAPAVLFVSVNTLSRAVGGVSRPAGDALLPLLRTAGATGAPAVLFVSVNTLSRAVGGVSRPTGELCRAELPGLSLAPPYYKAVIMSW
jgi:hypothetical protein